MKKNALKPVCSSRCPCLSFCIMTTSRDPYAALRHRPYRLFMLARLFFMIGFQMQGAAVGWQIYQQTGSKLALALVGLIQVVPILVLTIPAGYVADHVNRKKILLGTQTLFLVGSIALAILANLHADVRWLYLVLVCLASGRAFTMPAMGAILPNVAPREHWANAATWNSTFFELSAMTGPALAGLLIAASGQVSIAYVTAAGCTFVTLVSLALLPAVPQPKLVKFHFLTDLLRGLHFVFKTKVLLATASLDLFAMLLGGTTALLPVVATDILHVGPQGFGWMRAAPSIGALTMALVTAHRRPWKRAGRTMFLAFIGFGAAIVVFGLSRNFWLSMIMLIITGMCDNINVVIRQTLMQYVTPDEMRGRVSSVNALCVASSNELGSFESGFTAQLFGTVPAIVFGGGGAIVVALVIMSLAPQLRRLGPLHELNPVTRHKLKQEAVTA